MAGNIVTLTCTVTLPSGVTDTPVFQWEGPGGVTPTPEDSMTNGQTVSSDLILTAITTSHAGQYTCTATLSGYTYNDSININVQSKFNKPLIVNDDYNISIYNYLVSVPTPMILANVTGTVYAGTSLILSCDYTLSISVDTDITTSATWTINNTDFSDDDEDDDSISSDGVNLIFSPLTTTYTGIYTCTLTITPSSQTPHVTVQEPVQSSEENIIVQSKVHSILHVIVYNMTPLSLSPSA